MTTLVILATVNAAGAFLYAGAMAFNGRTRHWAGINDVQKG